MQSTYKSIMETAESTVVSEYTSTPTDRTKYQSEDELEKDLIERLQNQGYEYLCFSTEEELINNLRLQLEKLNNFDFSDNEWKIFYEENISNSNLGIVEKTKTIQQDEIKVLKLDDGNSKNIKLIDKKNIHNNSLQVINQYTNTGSKENRYDVTILINGLPLVHMELKRRGVLLRTAFDQIERYQRESFWSNSGLYEFIQIFVISNGTYTKYYSNTTRFNHISQLNASQNKNSTKTSNSYEFTSYWADSNNKVIYDLVDFTKTFLTKHTLLNVLTKYCVFTVENMLLVMRPYQIAATEKIINKINIAINYKYAGTVNAGGFVWHTTGSGKTLTSFKTAQIACNIPTIDKVLFVVDRQDLDYQTMKEYDRFEKGCANGNKSTNILTKQLEDETKKIIVTTIQKLNVFIGKNKTHDIYNKNVVLIFDECHRSQFGIFHQKIIKAFKHYYIFGFTGTPIFSKNAFSSTKTELATTEQVFGEKLHTYTIVDAIKDENVLPFRIDYINTIKKKDSIKDKKVPSIDVEKALMDPKRISKNCEYILENFETKTKRNKECYSFLKVMNITDVIEKQRKIDEIKQKVRLKGFNAILATSSIEMAQLYYRELKRQNNLLDESKKLNIAIIYSYGVNDEVEESMLDEENSDDTTNLSVSDRDFLEEAILDYNGIFHTFYDTTSDKFQNYYKDVSMRMKNREIDLLIVVNMFLTGFDATTLNTLWVDKNLKYHGLIQSFSRTNRILNSIKKFGNIICFRDLQKETDDAIALFGDKDAGGLILMKDFDSYYYGYDENGKHYDGYVEIVNYLKTNYPIGVEIVGETKEKNFINTFGKLLKLLNILTSFDVWKGKALLNDAEMQDYQSMYLTLYEKYKDRNNSDKEVINEDIEFETELIKQIEINIDYILMLIQKYHDSNCQNKEIIVTIHKVIDSSMQLRSKKELIDLFIESVNATSNITTSWTEFIKKQSEQDLLKIIQEENLKKDKTIEFMNSCFKNGMIKTLGADLDEILPPVSLFNGREETKENVIDKLNKYFEKYEDIL